MSGESKTDTDGANNEEGGPDPAAKPSRTLMAGTSTDPKGPEPKGPEPDASGTNAASTPARKAKGKTLAGGTMGSTRGKYWNRAPSDPDVEDAEILDEVTAEELIDTPPGPPPKKPAAPPRTPPRKPPGRPKSVPAPPLKSRNKPPLKDRGAAAATPTSKSVPPSPPRSTPPSPPLKSTPPSPPLKSTPPPKAEDSKPSQPSARPSRPSDRGSQPGTRSSRPEPKRASHPGPPRPKSEPPAALDRAPSPTPSAPTPSPAPIATPTPTPAAIPAAPTPSLDLEPLEAVCQAELVTSAKDPARAARLHFELGRAADNPGEALKHFRLALEKAPDFLPAIRAARELHLDKGNVKMAAPLFDAEIKLAPSAHAKATLLWAKGCAWLDHEEDREAARACFAEAAEVAPEDPTIVKALQHVEQKAKDWSKLTSALELEANATREDARHRAAVVTTRARMLERRLQKADDAVEQLQLALQLDPQTPLASPELKRLLYASGRWRELVGALEREASLTTNDEVRAQAWWNIAHIHSERLGSHAEAIAAMENAAKISGNDAGLLEELSRAYEAQGDDRGAASALERLAQAVERPTEKVAVYQRLAELADRADGDAQAAVRWYEHALAIDPSFSPALRALDRLYAKVGNWQALATTYAAEGGAGGPSAKRAAAFARAAGIFDRELGRPDLATTHYARALALDPSHEGAFKSLVRLYSAAGAHHELIELYDRAVDRARSEDIAIAYLFKMGSLYEDVLGDPANAVEIYQRILQRDAKHVGAIHAVQRAAEQAGQARALVEALDAEAALTKDDTLLVRLQHRAAEVVADDLGDLDGALSRLTTLLKRAPRDIATLETLARIHRRLGRHEDLLQINAQQLAVTDDDAKVSLLVSMGDLAERELGKPDVAIRWFKQALDLDPEHALAGAAVGRLLRATGDYRELSKVIAAELGSRTDPREVARLCVQLGEVHEVHLGDPKAAIEAYRRALETIAGYRPAVDALIRVYGAQQAHEELATMLALAAEDAGDPRLGLEAELLAATLRAERLNRGDEAAATIEAIVDRDPQNIAALRALETLYVDSDAVGPLAEVLTRQADVLAHRQGRVAALVARGRLLERTSGDEADGAIRSVCTAVLAADPTNDWALAALGRLADRTQDGTLKADVENRYTQAITDDNLLADHYAELGAALGTSNPAAALNAYRAALEHAPEHLTAIRGMAAMAAAMGDASTMVEAYRREAAWRRDEKASAQLYVQSAAVLARLGDLEGAIGDSEKALSTFPDHEQAAAQLIAFLLKANKTSRLTEQLAQAAHAANTIDRKVALWREVGRLHAERGRDLGAAITAVRRALEAKSDDMQTILQLAELHARDEQHDEAAELLARAVAIEDGNLDAHLKLALLYGEHLDEPKKAHRHIDRVLKDRPQDRDALRLRLSLQLAEGEREAARETSDALLEAAGDDDRIRAWALVEIGRSELAAGDSEAAAEAFHGAICLVGLEGEAASAYGKLLGDKEPWDRYASALSTYIKNSKSKSDVQRTDLAAVYLELARVQHRRLDKAVDAFRTIEQGVARCGAMPELELRQAELLVATHQHNEALLAFQALTAKHPQHHETWRGLVRVFQQLGRGAEASITASAIVALGEATDAERALAAERTLRPGAARPGSFAATSIRALSAGAKEDEEAIAGLFHALADPLGKTYPIPFDMYGVRKSDRIKARQPHPVRQEVDALCQIFAIEDVDLYVHAGMGGDVTVEVGDPPSLMVPASVAELPEAQRIFMLSRPLAAIAAGLHPVLKLGVEETGLVLAAAVRRLVPNFEDGQHDMDRLAILQDRLSPSWFGRGKVDEAVQRYYAQPVDAPTWAPTVNRTATRAAAILCSDLDAVMDGLRVAGDIETKARGEALVASSEIAADVLRNWMSERALEVRRLAGIIGG